MLLLVVICTRCSLVFPPFFEFTWDSALSSVFPLAVFLWFPLPGTIQVDFTYEHQGFFFYRNSILDFQPLGMILTNPVEGMILRPFVSYVFSPFQPFGIIRSNPAIGMIWWPVFWRISGTLPTVWDDSNESSYWDDAISLFHILLTWSIQLFGMIRINPAIGMILWRELNTSGPFQPFGMIQTNPAIGMIQ